MLEPRKSVLDEDFEEEEEKEEEEQAALEDDTHEKVGSLYHFFSRYFIMFFKEVF